MDLIIWVLTINLLETGSSNHCAPLVRWSFYKYKFLWGVGGGGQGSAFKFSGGSFTHIYT